MSTKGKTRWFPRAVAPVRSGYYECGVLISSSQRCLILWTLEWDGKGFLVPFPMAVRKWRGATKKAALHQSTGGADHG